MLGFCVDARHMTVDEVAETFCRGVPRDVGFESVGRGMFFDAIHEWGTEAATNAVDASIKALKNGSGFPLGVLMTYCMPPYSYPADEVVARVRSVVDFTYRSEDGFFAAPPAAAAAPSLSATSRGPPRARSAVDAPPPDRSANRRQRHNLPSRLSPPTESNGGDESTSRGPVRRKLVLQKRTNPAPVGGKAGESSRVF